MMALFWSFWIPLNVLWWMVKVTMVVKEFNGYVMFTALVFSSITGLLPFIIYTALT